MPVCTAASALLEKRERQQTQLFIQTSVALHFSGRRFIEAFLLCWTSDIYFQDIYNLCCSEWIRWCKPGDGLRAAGVDMGFPHSRMSAPTRLVSEGNNCNLAPHFKWMGMCVFTEWECKAAKPLDGKTIYIHNIALIFRCECSLSDDWSTACESMLRYFKTYLCK